MSSATTPPHSLIARKTRLATCIGVLLLHIAVGWALLHMPVVSLQPPKTTPPLEIAFVDLTPKAKPTVTPPEATKLVTVPPVETDPPPQPEPPTQQKTQAEVSPFSVKSVTNSPLPVPMPEREPKPQPTAAPPTDVELLPDIPLADAKDTPPPEPTQVEPTLVLSEAEPVSPPETAPIAHPDINQQAILAAQQAAQAELAAQQAREQAERERQAQQAREQAERERQAQQAREQAERERQAKLQAQQPQAVTFGSGDARWRVVPKTNFTGNIARLIESQQLTQIEARLQISPQGDVTAVSIVTSSGNSQVDNAIRQRLLAGKLYPYPTPRVGNLLINLN